MKPTTANDSRTDEEIRFQTHVSAPKSARGSIVGLLNIHLAGTLDLYSQVKQTHWTHKGPQFFARHELFDDVAAHLLSHSDDVAERIATLGGYPLGTIQMAVQSSQIPPFSSGHVGGSHLLRDLIIRFSKHASIARDVLSKVEPKDSISGDLITEQLRQIELDLWFFESHFLE